MPKIMCHFYYYFFYIIFVFFIIIVINYNITAQAGIIVIPDIINFNAADLPRSDLIVTNSDSQDAYIKVTPYKIINPGTSKEKRIIIHNPVSDGLLATPQLLIIPAHEHRFIRIAPTIQFNQQERIYRLEVVPVTAPITAQNAQQSIQTSQKIIGIHIIVGYDILAIVQPKKPQFNIKLYRVNHTLLINNQGNTNVLTGSIYQCNKNNNKNSCITVKNFRRLYSGNRQQIQLSLAAPAQVDLFFLGNKKTLVSN